MGSKLKVLTCYFGGLAGGRAQYLMLNMAGFMIIDQSIITNLAQLEEQDFVEYVWMGLRVCKQ